MGKMKGLHTPRFMKGLHTPRFLVFLSGWHHARNGFIQIDEWGSMQSGFIRRKQEDFEYYSAKVMEKMEESLSPTRVELKKLLLEYASLKPPAPASRPAKGKADKAAGPIQEHRAGEALKQAERLLDSRRKELFGEMIRLQNHLEMQEVIMEEELLAVSARLRAALSCYCHGALYHWKKREWDAQVVPEIGIDNRAYQLYHNRHKEDDDKVKEVIRNAGKIK